MNTLIEIIKELVDEGECRFDHNGHCQEHAYFGDEGECPHQKAKQIIETGEMPSFGECEIVRASKAGEELRDVLTHFAQQKRIAKLEEALETIVEWKLPETNKFWDKAETQPMSYESAYGTNGSRDYMRKIAREALDQPVNLDDQKKLFIKFDDVLSIFEVLAEEPMPVKGSVAGKKLKRIISIINGAN